MRGLSIKDIDRAIRVSVMEVKEAKARGTTETLLAYGGLVTVRSHKGELALTGQYSFGPDIFVGKGTAIKCKVKVVEEHVMVTLLSCKLLCGRDCSNCSKMEDIKMRLWFLELASTRTGNSKFVMALPNTVSRPLHRPKPRRVFKAPLLLKPGSEPDEYKLFDEEGELGSALVPTLALSKELRLQTGSGEDVDVVYLCEFRTKFRKFVPVAKSTAKPATRALVLRIQAE